MSVPEVELPPGPPLPRLAQTLGFLFMPLRFIEAARHRYGDVVTFRTAFDPGFVMVFDPELVKQVFQAPPEQLRAGEANSVLEPILGERSVLLLDGDEHLRQRRLMLPAFHGQRLLTYEQIMLAAADAAIDAWPVGEAFALMPSMQALTLEVIMSAIFGVEQGERREDLKRHVRSTLEPVSRRLSVVVLTLLRGRFGDRGPVREFERRRQALDEVIYREIASRRNAAGLQQREDVFSMLLCARDEDGRALTDRELRDELVTLLVAGHETTATGLAWAFDLLLHNPRVCDRLVSQVSASGDAGVVGREGAGGDAYLDAVVKETLRLRPVVPGIGRVVRERPFVLGDYVIAPGVEINPSIAAIHRRDDRYPDPKAFEPERFLGPAAPDTYTWIPFGGGTRRCLGASFAMIEMRSVIRRVLQRTRLEPVRKRPERVLRRGITQVPQHGVWVVQPRPPGRAPSA